MVGVSGRFGRRRGDPTARSLSVPPLIFPELPANLAWGEDGSVLYVTARTSVYRLPTLTRGTLPG